QRVDQLVVDRAGQAGGHQAGVARLVDGRAGDEFGRVDAQVVRAAVARAGLLAAVKQVAVEVRAQSSDAYAGGVAVLVTLRGDAGQSRQRFGDRGVGQLADVFRRDRLDDL